MELRTGLDNKKVALNIFFSCIAYIVNAFISLFITPYITRNLGAEAYGFVKLSNDFVGYGSLVSIAMNSMSSRFIMLKAEQGNTKEAKSYYTSVTVANIILSLILLVPTILVIVGINRIFRVPNEMLGEVRWTFIWTLSNFLICLAGCTFGNCFFLKNKLNISSILTSLTSIIRAVFIIVAFQIVGPKISIMAFGSIVVTAIFMPCNIYFHKKLTPELTFDKELFDFRKVYEVISSGIWNSITRLGQILLTGLDLTLTNILVDSIAMGYLSIAKTIPNFISSLINAIGGAFTPNMMQLYAKNDKFNLKLAIQTSMRIMTIFSTLPNAILIVLGMKFYELWVPEQPTVLINVLSIITIIGSCIIGPMQPIYQIFTLTNKIRQSSLVFIVEGIVSIIITMNLVKYTDLGVFAVAGVSVILEIIVALIYHLPWGSIYIGLKWYELFPEIFKTIIILILQCLLGQLIYIFVPIGQSWTLFLIVAGLIGVIGLWIDIFIILNRQERHYLKNRIIRYIPWMKNK